LVVVASLALTTSLSACGGSKDIVHGLDEFEANEILVVLESKNISADKTKEEGRVVAYTVVVSEGDSREAMKILVDNHLPRARSQGLKETYGAGSGGLIPTKSEEKAKYLMAVQGEIERKLKTLPGIVQAHVSVVQPDKDIIRDLDTPAPPSTASVAVVYNAVDDRGSASVSLDDVRSLVAASVEDLKPANVQVVMKKNERIKLVDDVAGAAAETTSESVMGIRVSDHSAGFKVKLMFGVFGVVALIGIAVGVGGVLRSIFVVRKLQAEAAAPRKARRETQTGLPP
jgi:type III secretion protein J